MDHVLVCWSGNTRTCPWYRKTAHFQLRGTLDALIKIARYEGITSLWSGLPPTLIMAVPATVIYFTSYERLKVLFVHKNGRTEDWWKPMAAGALARVWAVTLISPLELVRTKLQSEQMSYKEIGKALQSSVQHGGIMSLWRGLGPTILRDVPFSALYWFSYEHMKSLEIKRTGSSQLGFSQSFIAGAFSGTVAAIVTLPFDVIKTHRQIELGQAEVMSGKTQARPTWKLIHKLYLREGFSGLFTGLVPRVVKIAPACAIMISSYEYFKQFFRTLNEEAVQR
ncbi:probable mitochondrial glutathione transporter SLC25A40 isoform X2 [Liolophura sinensis]